MITRVAEPGDRNFILATWLRGLYYGDTWFQDIPKDIFMAAYHKIIEAILAHESTITVVACLKEDPSVILGYAVLNLDGTKLHWAFTKKAWRGIGIAKRLVPTTVTTVTHLTRTGKDICGKRALTFNPFTNVN